MSDVASNYRIIVEGIGEAAAKVGRRPGEIKLLGAAKAQSSELVEAAVAAGVKLIGENYVQEAHEKKRAVAQRVEWHMIGHLQRNKVRAAVEIFDMIESLDSLELARALDREGSKRGKKIRTLLEVNLAGETSKSGVPVDGLEDLLRSASELPNLAIEGLMTVPPFRENPEETRHYFQRLRDLQERLCDPPYANVDLKELSMGMTHDYSVAVEEGATIVRIGTALFGPRPS